MIKMFLNHFICQYIFFKKNNNFVACTRARIRFIYLKEFNKLS
jgi:hypothetical protein